VSEAGRERTLIVAEENIEDEDDEDEEDDDEEFE